jgi:hypothetical protein
MALTIIEIAFPITAVLALHQILFKNTHEELKDKFRTILYVTGGSLALFLLMGWTMDYGAPFDQQVLDFQFDASGSKEINQLIVSGLKADRQEMFMGQVWRYAGFLILVIGCLYLYLKKWIQPIWVIAILALVSTLDLFIVGKKYLNDDAYVDAVTYDSQNFNPSPLDQQLKTDTDPHFRVFNMLSDPYNESRTSYFHRSIGGYHPAKLRIYQDLIDRYMSNNINAQVLDMLDAKYMLRQSPFTGADTAVLRPSTMGAAWLVKNIQKTQDPVEALQKIGTMNLRDSAIVEVSDAKKLALKLDAPDTTARIGLARIDNDTLTYNFESTSPQFAVFSEIYYPKGWNAYVDGTQVDHYKTNYVLRGMVVLAGKHEIQFVFEPGSFKTGNQLSFASSILILLILIGSLYMAWKTEQRKEA